MSYFNNLNSCYLIAEIGVNHNGNIEMAFKMIDEAKGIGLDAVKFQTFSADALVSKDSPKVEYQQSTTSPGETHYEMIKKLELKREDHYRLKKYCDEINIDFLSTPYDIESANFLKELKVKLFKTASADLVDLPLQKFIAEMKKPTIISVGMAILGEIESIVNLYRSYNNNDLVLLHCVSNYPCEDSSLNMRVMNTLSQAFDLPVGYSDHSIGEEAAIISVTQNAKVIEKHFTLDKNLPGPDHRASSNPKELAKLVKSVRRAESMLGDPVKRCQTEEKSMKTISRKSIVLTKDLKKGDVITSEYLTMKRPGTGLNAHYIEKIIGKKVDVDLKKDTIITLEVLK